MLNWLRFLLCITHSSTVRARRCISGTAGMVCSRLRSWDESTLRQADRRNCIHLDHKISAEFFDVVPGKLIGMSDPEVLFCGEDDPDHHPPRNWHESDPTHRSTPTSSQASSLSSASTRLRAAGAQVAAQPRLPPLRTSTSTLPPPHRRTPSRLHAPRRGSPVHCAPGPPPPAAPSPRST